MRKLFEILLLMFISITGYSQCDSYKIIFVDSLGNEIDSNQTNLIYNGIDTISLDLLYDIDFTNLIGAFPDEVEVCMESFEKGEKIKILSGSFTGFSSEIIRMDEGKKSVILLIEIFGTQVVTSVQSVRISKIG